MKIKKSAGAAAFSAANTAAMLLLMAAALYPMVHVLFASISNPTLVQQHRGLILHPLGFDLSAFKAVFNNPMIPVGYSNTLFYLVAGTAVNVLLTTLGAYALSRKGLLLGKYFMFAIAFTMLFSGGMIPSYLLVRDLHMVNSRLALIIPNAISAWNLIIMRTSFEAVPASMEESAKLDGANDFIILFKIYVPLCLPVMAVMILFYGVGHWNSWFSALLYIRKRELYPLQLVLREILLISTSDMTTNVTGGDAKANIGETIRYATIVVATAPILCVYPFLQKYFVKGVMVGAIKG
ncbi:MAG: carbohydrate ABC transporter permease [Clostridiales bacterium]|jgi:putative aldouronate transport system permease protein|nr:carbohydrate ABC transporter permease [Clostridiales bacterium]